MGIDRELFKRRSEEGSAGERFAASPPAWAIQVRG